MREKERASAAALRQLSRKHVLVNPANLGANNSYGTPDFVKRGYYLDMPFNCKSCGVAQV